MSDSNRYIYYGLGAAAAIATIGVGIWYLSQIDEYEDAKKEIADLPDVQTYHHPQFGEVIEIETFVKITAIMKTEQLRKRQEQLESKGKSADYPLEHRRELYKAACKSNNWQDYDDFVVKNEAKEEELTSQTVKEVADIIGISENVINNTTQFSSRQMSNLSQIDTARAGYGGSKSATESKLTPKISRKETVEM